MADALTSLYYDNKTGCGQYDILNDIGTACQATDDACSLFTLFGNVTNNVMEAASAFAGLLNTYQ